MKEKTQLELRIEKMFENKQYKEIITEALKLYDIKEELINDINFLVDTVMMNPNYLYKPVQMLSRVKFNKECLDFTNGIKEYHLSDNKIVILNSVRRNGLNLSLASSKLKNNYDIVKEAINNNGLAIEYASKKLRSDYDLGVIAINNNPDSYYLLNENLKNNEDIIITLLVKSPTEIHNFDYLDNYNQIIRKVIKRNGLALKYLSNKSRDNERLVIAAIKNNINALEYASNRLKNDPDFIINLAVKFKTDNIIYFASEKLLHNKSFIIDIIRKIGFNLYLVHDEFKDDLDVVEAAVSVDIRNFEHASNRIKENEMIVLDLTKKYGSVIRYSSNKLLTNPDFMLKAIKVYSVSIKYISHELKENNDFIDEVIKIDKWNKEYLKGC